MLAEEKNNHEKSNEFSKSKEEKVERKWEASEAEQVSEKPLVAPQEQSEEPTPQQSDTKP